MLASVKAIEHNYDNGIECCTLEMAQSYYAKTSKACTDGYTRFTFKDGRLWINKWRDSGTNWQKMKTAMQLMGGNCK